MENIYLGQSHLGYFIKKDYEMGEYYVNKDGETLKSFSTEAEAVTYINSLENYNPKRTGSLIPKQK